MPELIAEAWALHPVFADTVRIDERDRPVEALPGYARGRWWVQDAAAAIPARLLKLSPGARVLDLCAAPGGKTAQLIKAGYAVTALDSDARPRGPADAKTSRGSTIPPEIVTADALHVGAFPDFRWHPARCALLGHRHLPPPSRSDLAPLVADIAGPRRLQRAVHRPMRFRWLDTGGVLIYCVCSLEPAEGEEQASWLAARDDVVADPVGADELPGLPEAITPEGFVRTHPGMLVPGDKGGTLDGFFVARFRRR
jgi:16S rRNA (cytosine967-C5)-methyltransferase